MVEQLWEDTINTSHCNTRLDLIIYSVLLFLWTYPQSEPVTPFPILVSQALI
jgi:hypothetical protein